MMRWGMVIDLRKCVGCQTCTIACKQTNNTPPKIFWRWVADIETGAYPEVRRQFVPMGCQHCTDAPCFEVCPTTATFKRADGIVDINYDLCIGCGYCIVACPYLARNIVFENVPYYAAGLIAPEQTQAHPDRIGVATKCNFCTPRVYAGLASGQKPGIDMDATPMCVGSCIANAMHFGDLDDAKSNVAQMVLANKTARLSDDLGTDPHVYYIVE
ncbi:MAG: 4Fe-4S dicluster domain-containing protein [Chloroflexi bacterium]|nr:4Fe-4S dicluster domain-containing protein [Chloroflexota bacterium]